MKKFLVPDVIYAAAEIEQKRYGSIPTADDLAFFERMAYSRVQFYPEEVKASPERLSLGKRIGLEHMNRLRAQHAPHADQSAVSSGDKNYDWMYLPERIDALANPVFLCAGAGINISFELDLATRYPHAAVFILDPSPQSVAHFADFDFPENVTFVEVGLGGTDDIVRFYKPNLKGAGSLSTMRLNPGEVYFSLPITTVRSFCTKYGIDPQSIALLKFDIEGAEHAVIDDLMASGILPPQVACEFDQPCPPWTIEDSMRTLLSRGYTVARIWGANALFVREGGPEAGLHG